MEFIILLVLVLLAVAISFPFVKESLLMNKARKNNAEHLTGFSEMSHEDNWQTPLDFPENDSEK